MRSMLSWPARRSWSGGASSTRNSGSNTARNGSAPIIRSAAPLGLHRYRKHRKSRREARADRVGDLAQLLVLPRSALAGENDIVLVGAASAALPSSTRPSVRDPDPFHELSFASPLAAKRAIADEIRLPLGKLSDDDRQFIDALVTRTLSRPEVISAVRQRFPQGRKGGVGSC